MLDDVQLEVGEAIDCEVIVGENPESATHVVSDLAIGETVVSQDSLEDGEAILLDEEFGKLIDLEQVHQTVSVGIS